MRRRNKPPTLVSMWMLDVFCCALGCMILLWVLESLNATDQSERSQETLAELSRTQQKLKDLDQDYQQSLASKNLLLAHQEQQLAALTAQRDKKTQSLTALQEEYTLLLEQWFQAQQTQLTLEEHLQATQKSLMLADVRSAQAKKWQQQLQDKLTAAEEAAQKLQVDLTKAQIRSQHMNTQLDQTTEALTKARQELKNLQDQSDDYQRLVRQEQLDRSELQQKLKNTEQKLIDLDAQYKQLAKSKSSSAEDIARTRQALDNANANIIDLQGEKKKLADKLDRLRIESEAKFAGIATTGRRVVFLIDISGSMELLDEKTRAPGKWLVVVETIGKLMRSIPDLEQYQVILFSRDAQHLFQSTKWLDFKGEASVLDVTSKLKEVKPVGDTNMYKGFDLAFKLREQGLDTIYLFSDGLPTSGPGLSDDQKRLLDASKQMDLLAKFLRNKLSTDWNRAIAGRRVKINSVGFFFESPEVGAFLWALSRENEGSFVGMSRP